MGDIDVLLVGAGMGSNPLAVMEDGDRGGSEADHHFLADQRIGHAVPGALHRHMVVNVDFGFLPIPQLKPLCGQSLQRRLVDLGKELVSGFADPLHGAVVQFLQLNGNGIVQFRQ